METSGQAATLPGVTFYEWELQEGQGPSHILVRIDRDTVPGARWQELRNRLADTSLPDDDYFWWLMDDYYPALEHTLSGWSDWEIPYDSIAARAWLELHHGPFCFLCTELACGTPYSSYTLDWAKVQRIRPLAIESADEWLQQRRVPECAA